MLYFGLKKKDSLYLLDEKNLFHCSTYGQMTDNPCFYHLQFEDLPKGSPYGKRGALRTIYFQLSEEREGKMMFIEELYYASFSKYVTLLNPHNNCLNIMLLPPF